MESLHDILARVNRRIESACLKAGRDPAEVEIVAVTKTHGEETVREAWEAGLRIVGENKVQEASWKKSVSISGPSWHLIGHLQTNKVRQALEIFDFIHSVDSVRLAERISHVAEETGARPHLLFEVNVSGEKSKNGMAPGDVLPALEHVFNSCPRLTVEGLMTMAPFSENPEDSRVYFRALRKLKDSLERDLGVRLPRLSMGMSGDYEVAVEEGATYLRLGSVLFGERPKLLKAGGSAAEFPLSGEGGLDSYSGEGPTCKILD